MEPQMVSNDGDKLCVLTLPGVASKSEFESGRTKPNYKQGRKAQMKPPFNGLQYAGWRGTGDEARTSVTLARGAVCAC